MGERSTCKTCQWWQPTEGQKGECHGAPPSVVFVPRAGAMAASATRSKWPMVKDTDWCGAHEPREGAG